MEPGVIFHFVSCWLTPPIVLGPYSPNFLSEFSPKKLLKSKRNAIQIQVKCNPSEMQSKSKRNAIQLLLSEIFLKIFTLHCTYCTCRNQFSNVSKLDFKTTTLHKQISIGFPQNSVKTRSILAWIWIAFRLDFKRFWILISVKTRSKLARKV